jgi:hypothetical protein
MTSGRLPFDISNSEYARITHTILKRGTILQIIHLHSTVIAKCEGKINNHTLLQQTTTSCPWYARSFQYPIVYHALVQEAQNARMTHATTGTD